MISFQSIAIFPTLHLICAESPGFQFGYGGPGSKVHPEGFQNSVVIGIKENPFRNIYKDIH
jgi:hypothetical protein